MADKSTKETEDGLSLTEFMKREKRKDCPICKLPEAVQTQLQEAPDKSIKVDLRVKWLREAHGLDIKASDITRHMCGRHYHDRHNQ